MTEPRRILVLGGQGQVARELRRTLATLGQIVPVARSAEAQHHLDLSHPDGIEDLVAAVKPTWIVNAAAHTAVDRAEQEVEAATTINGTAPGLLAAAARRHDALLVHYSTDYVFDGCGERPYAEDDLPNPQSVYGRSKLQGETAIREAGAAHLILRTAWVYGARGQNFMRTIRRLAREREELRIVADQRGAPTWSRHIAEATAQILAILGDDRVAWRRVAGVYHLVSGGETSWFDFASRIVEHQRQHEPVRVRSMLPIRTEEYPTPAKRPAYSVLACDKLARTFGIRLPRWEMALRQVQEDLDSYSTL